MVGDLKENAIEFYKGDKRATGSFSQERYIIALKKYAEEYPDECQLVAENLDGSCVFHFPTKWVKVKPPKKMSDEQKEAFIERMSKSRAESE